MRYMLDSNAIIALTMNTSAARAAGAAEGESDELVTRAVACAEVVYGSSAAKPPPLEQLRAFVEEVPVLAFDYGAALAYATLPFGRARYDRLIAAHALSQDLIVVTDNGRDFADVPGLRVENWMD